MKSKQGLTARSMRIILVIIMVLILLVASIGFYFAQHTLHMFAASISQLNSNASAGDTNVRLYRELASDLKNSSTVVDKARSITASNDSYQYQDQIVSKLNQISQASKITVTSYSFSDTTANTATGISSTPAATPAPAATAPGAVNGVATKTVSVSIASPVEYSSIMRFIQLVESSQLKMQIQRVSLTKAGGTAVASEGFTIEVYVR